MYLVVWEKVLAGKIPQFFRNDRISSKEQKA